MNNYTLISVGPSLVDITIQMSDDDHKILMQRNSFKTGGWYSFSNFQDFDQVFKDIFQSYVPSNSHDLLDLISKFNSNISAGSTNLGLLSALPNQIRNKTAFISTIGKINGNTDAISNIFTSWLLNLGIEHISIPIQGLNPLGLVITSDNDPEKTNINYLGVSRDLSHMPQIKSDYLYIDAYELTSGKISHTIDDIVRSDKYKICLGLGNKSILEKDMISKIHSYMINNHIAIMVGNEDEFKKIYPFSNVMDIRMYSIFSKIRYMLITSGDKGLFGVFEDEIIFQKSYPTMKLVSTSGAGDIAAGVFISGIINNDDHKEILDNASFFSMKILEIPENVFYNGIPSR